MKYVFQVSYWNSALSLLEELKALSCLHQDLTLTRELKQQVRRVSLWLKYLEPKVTEHWLIRLETLISDLPLEARIAIAENLQLPKDSLQRLQQLEQLEEIETSLTKANSTSQIYQLLQPYKPLQLILFAAKTNRQNRRFIWQYLTNLSQAKPLINGGDLKVLGFKPGPMYKQILDDVLFATLDGHISDRAEAVKYVKSKYIS